ncbi:RsmD family RNA methyltransferase [Pseudothermotoga thermarum]|uniref:Methyltransferase n=1 Tax=Pseudothermotoga thermarum DSM 5069 TaxID=688269 RepID=F7YW49_9THEM|nr:RsmD family RNA methyltransferase [Pseudothermotoga thermarum]AEH50538.1 methyltransferase [Pseudothermotoga thermarum DSM 5069]
MKSILRITGGFLKGRLVKPVPDPRTRYTGSMVRQAIFNMIDVKDKTFLELFCGSAVVSIEAISRGAKSATVVDISPLALKTALQNAENCGIKLEAVRADFKVFLKNCSKDFDIVFADPPYNAGYVDELLKILAEKPNVGSLIVIEKAFRETYDKPTEFEILKSKRYGDSEVVILERRK